LIWLKILGSLPKPKRSPLKFHWATIWSLRCPFLLPKFVNTAKATAILKGFIFLGVSPPKMAKISLLTTYMFSNWVLFSIENTQYTITHVTNTLGLRPSPRYNHTQTLINIFYLVVMGGQEDNHEFKNDLYLLNLFNLTWTFYKQPVYMRSLPLLAV